MATWGRPARSEQRLHERLVHADRRRRRRRSPRRARPPARTAPGPCRPRRRCRGGPGSRRRVARVTAASASAPQRPSSLGHSRPGRRACRRPGGPGSVPPAADQRPRGRQHRAARRGVHGEARRHGGGGAQADLVLARAPAEAEGDRLEASPYVREFLSEVNADAAASRRLAPSYRHLLPVMCFAFSLGDGGRARGRAAEHAARRGRDARVHARGHRAARSRRVTPRDLHDAGRADHPGQHLPPDAAPGRRRWWRELGGLHGFTGWRGPYPHRQRRLPGLQPGARCARIDRRGRALPDPPRRLAAPAHARSGRWRSSANLGADIIMAFDECPPRPARRARRSPRRRRAPRAGRARSRDALAARAPRHRRRSSASCRAACTSTCASAAPRELVALDFPGYAIGGLLGGRAQARTWHACWTRVAPLLPADRPRYLMGVGTPEDLLEGVAPRHRHVRLRPAHPQRAQRPALHQPRPPQHPQRPLPRRPAPARPRVRLLHLPHREPRLPAAPAPGRRDDGAATLATIHNLTFYLDTLRADEAEYPFGSFRGVPAEMRSRALAAWTSPSTRVLIRTPRRHEEPRCPKPERMPEVDLEPARPACSSPGRPARGEPARSRSLILMGLIFGIFYFVAHPADAQQAEEAGGARQGASRPATRSSSTPASSAPSWASRTTPSRSVSPTRRAIKVLKSAVAGLQGSPAGHGEEVGCLPHFRTPSCSGSCSPPRWPPPPTSHAPRAARARDPLRLVHRLPRASWPPYGRRQPGRIHLGLDLKGGIHLVLAGGDRRRAERDRRRRRPDRPRPGQPQGHLFVGPSSGRTPTSFTVEGVEPARVKDVRDILKDFFRQGWEIREPGEGRFLVKMTERVQPPDARADRDARRCARSSAASTSSAWPSPSSPSTASRATRSSSSSPASRTSSSQAGHPDDGAAHAQAGRGPGRRAARPCCRRSRGKVPDEHGGRAGPGRRARPADLLPGAPRRRVITGRRPQERARGRRREQPARRQLLAQPGGADKFKHATGANVGRQLAIVLDERGGVGARHPEPDLGRGPDHAAASRPQEADELAKVLRAGALPATLKYLQELTVGAVAGQGLRSAPASRPRVAGMAFLGIFMLVYYRLSGVNAVVALVANLVILMGAMAYIGRHAHAARHRRRHPDDRRRRRHQRAGVRAHPRGAAQRQDRERGRAATASSASGSPSSTPTPPR